MKSTFGSLGAIFPKEKRLNSFDQGFILENKLAGLCLVPPE